MLQTAPYIPENAPFSPEQRAWLNGFLAGLFSPVAQPAVASKDASLKLTVYFGSQSGTAERLAKKVSKHFKAQGHSAQVQSLESATPASLGQQEYALFCVSTYGEGDPPDNVKSFRDELFSSAAPALACLRFSVLALGDKHYEHFCKFGIDLDARLEALGGQRLTSCVVSDVDVDGPFTLWIEELESRLTSGQRPNPTTVSADRQIAPTSSVSLDVSRSVERTPKPEQLHTRENPFQAQLRDRRRLTAESSEKTTIHLSFALEDSAVHYEPGDACGVIPQNDPCVVDELLAMLPFSGDTSVEISKLGTVSVRDALLHHTQHTRLTRKMVETFAGKTGSALLSSLLAPGRSKDLEGYLYDRGLIDLLHEFPGTITVPEDLIAMLPRLAPRLYSISSSPAAHGSELHCTIAVVRYRSHGRERGGVASTLLAERLSRDSRLPIYIHANRRFRLPADGDTPIVMIGPGTGIAPFRSFLHERQALGHRGRNWLFFGERSAATDFLYREELLGMHESGHLTRLDTAFSRDQANKVYVQDRMTERGDELWRWLNDGAQIYVCGDASRMAKDVDCALQAVVATHGNMKSEAARDYVSQLQEDHRYHRDVY